MLEYKTISESYAKKFDGAVNAAFKSGWQLFGQPYPTVRIETNANGVALQVSYYNQAVTREVKDEVVSDSDAGNQPAE